MDEPDGERKRRGSASQVEAVYSLPPSLPPQPRPGPSRPLAALPPISHHRAPPSLAPLDGFDKDAQKLAKIVRKQSYIEEEIERRKEQEDRKQQKRDEKEAKRNSVPVGV